MITAKEIDDAGVRRLDLAKALGVPYSTLTSRLTGYAPMTEEDEKKIRVEFEKLKLIHAGPGARGMSVGNA